MIVNSAMSEMYFLLSPGDSNIIVDVNYYLVIVIFYLVNSNILTLSHVKAYLMMDVVVIDIINNHFQKQLHYPYLNSKIHVRA